MAGTNSIRSDDATSSDWQRAHTELSRLAKQRASADAEEGRWLLAALRAATHLHLGFASFSEYIERCFGYQQRTTQEKLRVAEALDHLPHICAALASGALHWSAARELTRVAQPQTEREWLLAARGKTVRQLEELVAGKVPGDVPSSPSNPALRRHVLRFEVSSEAYAQFRDAVSALRRRSNEPLDDDALLLAIAREVLGGPGDDGRASYQIAVHVCPECGRADQEGGGQRVPVAADVVDMALCDAQHVDLDASAPANDAPASAHVGVSPPRATQTIPPSLRRAVLLRDHHRCRVPGCRNSTFLDLHHIRPRAEGGRHEADNLLTLCGAHHRAAHRGQLLLEGCATSVRFLHADGSEYGQLFFAAADPFVKVASALRNLGFRESEANAALAKLRGSAPTTSEALLRAGLAILRRPPP